MADDVGSGTGLTLCQAFQEPGDLIVRDGRDPPSGARFRKCVCGLEIVKHPTRATMHFHPQGSPRQPRREFDDRQITNRASWCFEFTMHRKNLFDSS